MIQPTTKIFVHAEFQPGDKRNVWLWNAHRTSHSNIVFLAPGGMVLGAVREIRNDELETLQHDMKRHNCWLQPVEVFIDNHKHLNCSVFSLNLNAKN